MEPEDALKLLTALTDALEPQARAAAAVVEDDPKERVLAAVLMSMAISLERIADGLGQIEKSIDGLAGAVEGP